MMGCGSPMTKGSSRNKYLEMSPDDKRKSVYGDNMQGDKLVKKKYSTPSYHSKPLNSGYRN